MKLIVAASGALLISILLIIYFNFFDVKDSRAFSSGDYRTTASGDWNDSEVWEVFDGTDWNPASVPPDEQVKKITITNQQKLIISNEEIINNLMIDEGAILELDANTLTCNKIGDKGGITCNGTLILGTSILEGNGDFILGANSTLMIGSDLGIDKKGKQGNIQMAGKKEFNKEATYVFNGTIKQRTGNGLPVVIRNLVIDNTSGVAIDQNFQVLSNLTLTNGVLQTGLNILTLGASTTNTCKINFTQGSFCGNIKYWFGSENVNNLTMQMSDMVNSCNVKFNSAEPAFQKGMIELTYTEGIPDDSQKSPFAARQIVVAITQKGYFSAMLSNGPDEAGFKLAKIEEGKNFVQNVNWDIIKKSNSAGSTKALSNILYGPQSFENFLVVRFFSDQKTLVNFQLLNSKGQSALMENLEIQPGYNQHVFSAPHNLPAGSYMVQISNASEIHTFRVNCINKPESGS